MRIPARTFPSLPGQALGTTADDLSAVPTPLMDSYMHRKGRHGLGPLVQGRQPASAHQGLLRRGRGSCGTLPLLVLKRRAEVGGWNRVRDFATFHAL